MSARWPYKALGDPKSPPLIFLHGFLGSHHDWLPVARAFASAYHCILPDLPGHGENTHIDLDATLTFDHLSGQLLQFMDDLNLDAPVLVGYSLGGRTALNFAIAHSNRLCALILESTSPGITSTQERKNRATLDDARADAIRKDLHGFLNKWYAAGLWASLKNHPEKLKSLLQQRSTGNANTLAKIIADLSPGRMPSRWANLPHLLLPTLLLAGKLDAKYTDIIQRSAATIPNSKTVFVDQSGHNIHLEQPESFIQEIKTFLAQTPPHQSD